MIVGWHRIMRERALGLPPSLWALIAPPLTWAVHFLFSYVYAAVHCAKAGRLASAAGMQVAIGAATALALVVVVICAYVAWVHSRVEGDPPPHQDSTDVDRSRFLAVATLLLAGLSFVAIVFTAMPAFLIGDCR